MKKPGFEYMAEAFYLKRTMMNSVRGLHHGAFLHFGSRDFRLLRIHCVFFGLSVNQTGMKGRIKRDG